MRFERPARERMKVLQFVEGGARYGAAVGIRTLAEGLRADGIDLHFCVFRDRPMAAEMRGRGFPVIELDARNKFDLRAVSALRSRLKSERFDLVHSHLSAATLIGSFAGRLAKVP